MRIPCRHALSCLLALTVLALRPGCGAEAGEKAKEAVRALSPGNTAYYVDSNHGSDTNPGRSPKKAWKSIGRANETIYQPGDRLLFAGGQTFKGTLNFQKADHGTPEKPVVVGSYGDCRAVIDGGTGGGFMLTESQYVRIEGINFTGCGRKNGSEQAGVTLRQTEHVELDKMEISGFRIAGVAAYGDRNTRMTHLHVHDNGYAGITLNSDYEKGPRTANFYIGYCVAENNPGDPTIKDNHSGNGIVVGGFDGGVIEYCEAMNNGWDMPRTGNGPVGIWGFCCDNLVIQHCISHDNKSPGLDGGGFDFDGGVTNSIMQYNLSYNNVGCGYLFCQYKSSAWKNNILRYNISINDGSKNFNAGIGLWLGEGDMSGAQIYNNTIVNPAHAVNTGGDVPGMVYRNNIFVVGGDVLAGDFTHSRFENNIYWNIGKCVICRNGKTVFASLEDWAHATKQESDGDRLLGRIADPMFLLPGKDWKAPTDPMQLPQMRFFRLQKHSPCGAAGQFIPDNGGRDFFGRRLPECGPPSIGACETVK